MSPVRSQPVADQRLGRRLVVVEVTAHHLRGRGPRSHLPPPRRRPRRSPDRRAAPRCFGIRAPMLPGGVSFTLASRLFVGLTGPELPSSRSPVRIGAPIRDSARRSGKIGVEGARPLRSPSSGARCPRSSICGAVANASHDRGGDGAGPGHTMLLDDVEQALEIEAPASSRSSSPWARPRLSTTVWP